MYHLNFLVKLYLVEYIKDVVIPETNKRLNSAMNLSEYFCVIVCCLIVDFLCWPICQGPIIPQKGVPIHFNHIISGRRLKNITQVMS